MIWTAIFEDQTVKIFSTQNNSYEEAKKEVMSIYSGRRLFVLIKGSHPDVSFF